MAMEWKEEKEMELAAILLPVFFAAFFAASLVYWIDRSDANRPDVQSRESESDTRDEYPRAA